MKPSETKANRLLQIEALLLAHPNGLTQSDLARKLGVNRSTIQRNLADLPVPIYDEGNRILIDRQAYLVNVRLNLNEAMSLHLATRLLATRLERHNPHAASALRKLGIAIERLAPRISAHMLLSANDMDDHSRRHDANFLRTLEVVTQAWAQLQKVQVWHSHDEEAVREYTFAPYFIEPYAIGQAVHVIGLREPPGKLRTLKLERIQRVELLHEGYVIPPDFDPAKLLKDAWGIWYTEEEPVEVVLKFSQRAAKRVGETRWHRSEQVEHQPDGCLLWRARIAEPQEMMPWIRGWGADVEVLKPEKLRSALQEEAQRLARMYVDAPSAPESGQQ